MNASRRDLGFTVWPWIHCVTLGFFPSIRCVDCTNWSLVCFPSKILALSPNTINKKVSSRMLNQHSTGLSRIESCRVVFTRDFTKMLPEGCSAWPLACRFVQGDFHTPQSTQCSFPHTPLSAFHDEELERGSFRARAQNHEDNHRKFNSVHSLPSHSKEQSDVLFLWCAD